jgi:MerR family transcriptional regulator, heat shock protein HspR
LNRPPHKPYSQVAGLLIILVRYDEDVSEETPSVDDPDYPLYTVGQATEFLGINPPTLRRWEREGLVSPHRTDGGQRRYTRKELDQLQEIAQLTDEGVTTAGIRKVLELRQRIDQLEDQLAAQDAAEPPDDAPER